MGISSLDKVTASNWDSTALVKVVFISDLFNEESTFTATPTYSIHCFNCLQWSWGGWGDIDDGDHFKVVDVASANVGFMGVAVSFEVSFEGKTIITQTVYACFNT